MWTVENNRVHQPFKSMAFEKRLKVQSLTENHVFATKQIHG